MKSVTENVNVSQPGSSVRRISSSRRRFCCSTHTPFLLVTILSCRCTRAFEGAMPFHRSERAIPVSSRSQRAAAEDAVHGRARSSRRSLITALCMLRKPARSSHIRSARDMSTVGRVDALPRELHEDDKNSSRTYVCQFLRERRYVAFWP